MQSTRLLDQLRERIRYMHYSLSTEKVYLYWVRFFIRWHGRNGQMRHQPPNGQGQQRPCGDADRQAQMSASHGLQSDTLAWFELRPLF